MPLNPFEINNKRIWFVRHGESSKNVDNVHGGSGGTLTTRGLAQCVHLANMIKNSDPPPRKVLVVGHHVKQVLESLNVFVAELNCDQFSDERIRGVYLGIADGVSRDELLTISPDDAKQLDLWRAREITVDKFHVTGMESVDAFHKRISNFLEFCHTTDDYNTIIVVCTTSVMIMILNLIVLADKFAYDSYRHYQMNPGDHICVEVCAHKLWLAESSVSMD